MMLRHIFSFLIISSSFIFLACGESGNTPAEMPDSIGNANITQVEASASTQGFTFQVTISSPDEGCNQYADWWEVINENGDLLYRRILAHSHVDEQPFTRSGGPVEISESQKVWIRAHMNNSGYGGTTLFGSVTDGFETVEMPDGFASDLENEAPLPDGCAF